MDEEDIFLGKDFDECAKNGHCICVKQGNRTCCICCSPTRDKNNLELSNEWWDSLSAEERIELWKDNKEIVAEHRTAEAWAVAEAEEEAYIDRFFEDE